MASAAGYEVIAASHAPFDMDGAAVEVFDLRDPSAVGAVVARARPDAVIHLAAQASVTRSWELLHETLHVNVVGTGVLLAALADRSPGARVVMVGSGQEYGSLDRGRPFLESDPLEPATPYAASKVAQEIVAQMTWRSRGVGAIMARPFNHTGPGQSADYAVGAFCASVSAIAAGDAEPVLRVGDLEAERDLLDVRDVAAAYLLLLDKGAPGEAYNVASGRARRMGEVLDLVLQASGLQDAVQIESSGARAGDARRLVGDASKLAALGWVPRISLEDSITEMLDSARRARLASREG